LTKAASNAHIRKWFQDRVPLLSESDSFASIPWIDKISRKDFFKLFVIDILEHEKLWINQVPSRHAFEALWDKGPNAEFEHVVIRKSALNPEFKVWPAFFFLVSLNLLHS
jgi:hypothetical protein